MTLELTAAVPSSMINVMANKTDSEGVPIDILSDKVMPYIYTINLAILCGLLSLIGIVTNSINIAIFLRQGFKETINISLLSLAISDLCSLIPLLFVSVCCNPFFMFSGLPVLTLELQHVVGGWLHIMFVRITGLITVFITFERCLCIAFPFKVKNILNPKRVTILIACIYVFVLGNFVPNYFGSYIGWKYVPILNRTMIGQIESEHRAVLSIFSQALQPFYPVFSFTAVVVCTYILISKLNKRGKWLQTASADSNENRPIIRDRQVIKTVTYVAMIFIISYIPSLSLFITMLIIPEFNLGLRYENSFILTCSISFAFEGFNSAVNAFVYYHTSSKFKQQFRDMFCNQKTAE